MVRVEVRQPLSNLPEREILSFSVMPRVGEHFFHPTDSYLIFEVTAVIHFPSNVDSDAKTAIHCVKVDRIPNVQFEISTDLQPD